MSTMNIKPLIVVLGILSKSDSEWLEKMPEWFARGYGNPVSFLSRAKRGRAYR